MATTRTDTSYSGALLRIHTLEEVAAWLQSQIAALKEQNADLECSNARRKTTLLSTRVPSGSILKWMIWKLCSKSVPR